MQPPPWVMAYSGSAPYHGPWIQVSRNNPTQFVGQTSSGPLTQPEASPLVKLESVTRAMQQIVKKDNDVAIEAR